VAASRFRGGRHRPCPSEGVGARGPHLLCATFPAAMHALSLIREAIEPYHGLYQSSPIFGEPSRDQIERLVRRRRSCSAGDRATYYTKTRRSLVNLRAASRAAPASSIRTSGAAHPNGSDPSQHPIAQRVGSRCGQSPQVKSISSPSISSDRPFVPHCPVRKTSLCRGSRTVRHNADGPAQ
jgi:hypothetical protein